MSSPQRKGNAPVCGTGCVSLELEKMRIKMCATLLTGFLVLAICPAAWATDATGAAKTPEAAKKSSVTEKNKVQVNADAEARYQEYLEREKAASDRDIETQRTKIEDKYKGYVRPKREKKAPKK